MLSILKLVLNWASGGVLDKVFGHLENKRRDELAAMSEERRLEHDKQQDVRNNAKEIRLATAGYWEMRAMAFIIALPFVEQLWAVWMDTRWGIYSAGGVFERCWIEGGSQRCGVPAFPAPFDEWQGAILLSFFGLVGAVSGVKAAAGAIAFSKRNR